MIQDIDWTFSGDSNILIKTGLYKDTVYRYNKVKIYEKEINGELSGVLEFEFDIISARDDISDEARISLEKDPQFQSVVGDILCDLLQNDEIRIGEEKIDGEA